MIKKIIPIFVFAIILTHLVGAFGVVSPYFEANPLKLAPGEEKIVTLYLQNMVGEEKEVVFKANVTNYLELATIVDNDPTYKVPFGREDIPVMVKIKVPENYNIGDTKEVAITFFQVSPQGEDFVNVAGAFVGKIYLEVVNAGESTKGVQEPITPTTTKKGNSNQIILLLILIVIIIGLIIFVKKHRQNQTKNK